MILEHREQGETREQILTLLRRQGQLTAAEGGTVYYLVHRVPVVSGRDLRTAKPSLDENNRPAVSFSLKPDGATKFGNFTGSNIGRYLAIVLDKESVVFYVLHKQDAQLNLHDVITFPLQTATRARNKLPAYHTAFTQPQSLRAHCAFAIGWPAPCSLTSGQRADRAD